MSISGQELIKQASYSLSGELEILIDAVVAAGTVAQLARRGDFSVVDVPGKGLVSMGDLKVDDFLSNLIKVNLSQFKIFSEESDQKGNVGPNVVIVDPIDGTRWYTDGGDMWTVAIGIIADGLMQAAVTYQPDAGNIWIAEKNKGAYAAKAVNQHRLTKIATIKETRANKVKIGVGGNMSSLETRKDMTRLLAALIEDTRGPYIMASTALELAYVAEGITLSGNIHPHAKPWDKAGGMLLISEAGGVATGWPGRHDIFETGLVAAANIEIHKYLLGVINHA